MPENADIRAKKMIAALKQASDEINEVTGKKNLTHQEIADKTGFAQPNISRLLSGKYDISIENYLKLADVLGVKVKLEYKGKIIDLKKISIPD